MAIFSVTLIFSILVVMPLAASASVLTVSVYTGKPWYSISENVIVYGSVLSNGTPVPSAPVALEVHDPSDSPVILRSLQTNSSGVYSLNFKLPQEAPAGGYNVYVSCTYGAESVFNNTSFKASALAVTITTEKQFYNIGENITISGDAALNSVKLPRALIAIEVQNPNATAIVVRVLETDSLGAYNLTFQVPTGSVFGTYTAFASASHEDSIATAQTSFTLRPETTSADINKDGAVNILDLSLVARAWGSSPGDPLWDPRCDVVVDAYNKINILDITFVAGAWTG
jgi:uncharacterized protein YfaS (alpha-2-macroglobulin family)